MNYVDRSLTCVQCGSEFNFSADDQAYHASRGYQEPRRCPNCRRERRTSSGGGFAGGGYSERPQREMFTTTCSRCGGEARVPFVPRNDRPVYCSNCFQPRSNNSLSSW